jgi:hypothetical protein
VAGIVGIIASIVIAILHDPLPLQCLALPLARLLRLNWSGTQPPKGMDLRPRRVPERSETVPPSSQKVRKSLDLLARSEGFEPPTPRFEVWCSIQLSYERRSFIIGGSL